MDIGFVTSLVSIPLVGALGTAAWRIQATITARKQSEIDALKTEIESVRTIHSEQMTLIKEKNDLSNDQIETLIKKRTDEMTQKIEVDFIDKLRKWKQNAVISISFAIGLAVFVFGLLFSMFPRSASDEPVMTLINSENVSNEITNFGLHNDSVAGTILFTHGPTFMWGTILSALILAIPIVMIIVNTFIKSSDKANESQIEKPANNEEEL
jgi:hypothetical protein|tara:strand:- start:1412 stop:2044 length:633 start_codon:yes stop_codon:yes gene_type:complete